MADIKINGVTPTGIYVGSTAASAVYYGNAKVWESAPSVPDFYLGTNWTSSYIYVTAGSGYTYGSVWTFQSNIDFSTIESMRLYTESSIGQYTGVNMRKTNVGIVHGNFSNATSSTCYYYPAFIQFTGTSQPSMYTTNISWGLFPTTYNGVLASGEDSGDMPGTLTYNTYGSHSVKVGLYAPYRTTYFCIVVTNTNTITSSVAENFGILYNGYFNTNPGIKVVGSSVNPQSAIIT